MQNSFWLKSGCQVHYRVGLSGQKVITQSHFLTAINTNIESNFGWHNEGPVVNGENGC